MQILNNLTGDLEENTEYDNRNFMIIGTQENDQEDVQVNNKGNDSTDQLNVEDNHEDTEDEDDSENDCEKDEEKDIDETFNEIDKNKINEIDEKQIITRTQKYSIINSRDQIFMRKDNYLYFLTADGKP